MPEVDACWLDEMDGAIAQLVEDLVAARFSFDPGTARPVQRLAALRPAPDALHAAVLATRLLGASRSLVLRLHTTFSQVDRTDTARPRVAACTCDSAAWAGVGAFATWPDGDPRLTFASWLTGFLAHFDREHPRTPAERAADLIRGDPTIVWRTQELAQRLDVSRLELRRQFRAQFAVRIPEYVQLARAARAIPLLGGPTKVEAIAWEVGYRSKKDLYASLKRWADATPSELRRLTDEERRWLGERLVERMKPVVRDAKC